MRKRILVFLVFIGASLVITVAHSQMQPGAAADEAAIRTILDARNAAYNKHDAHALAAAYAQDADLITGTGRLVSGRADIEKNYVDSFAGIDKTAFVRIDSSKLRFLTPDAAILDRALRTADCVWSDARRLALRN